MAILAASTSLGNVLKITSHSTQVVLQRAIHKDRVWNTFTGSGFAVLDDSTESPEPVNAGDFVDSFNLTDGLWEYRAISTEDYEQFKDDGSKWDYSPFVKYGKPDAVGYSFNNYHAPDGQWGEVITPDDLRYTYLWGTDFKATNGDIFTDEQIKYFIDQSVAYMERELNITIRKRIIKCNAKKRGLKKITSLDPNGDYTDEESFYDFKKSKIQRYTMLRTSRRPILDVQKFELVCRGGASINLLDTTVIDRKKGVLKSMFRPFINSQKYEGINDAISRFGNETFQPNMFYSVDYTAGYENSDEVPDDLREIIAKVGAVSLLNIIGDGLMSGFSSSSLSMDGISESFSSTQSATSSFYGARIAVYKDDIKNYINENKYKFNNLPIGCL
ncbi:hypothetical protein [Treponema sp.]|uniref:hypothetical protein n=1 Tax=Treponema sp. TaxID=166 RepID=UPI00298E099E|nr:hypothetical protein [Treponema sp.]MCQ2242478.1 hypothetical protein [Treponema sp.]